MTFKRILTVFGVLALAAIPSFADVSGSPLLDYGVLDGCAGCIFPVIQFSAADVGQTVISYSFYAGSAGYSSVAGHGLTPILFEETGFQQFTIRGIGATDSGFQDNAVNTESFVLASGSATVLDGNTFFGYVDGTAGGVGNTGTISMSMGGGPVQFFSWSIGSLSVGESIGMNSLTGYPYSQNTRTYALEVATPEPGFYGIFAIFMLGLTGLFAAMRRRQNA